LRFLYLLIYKSCKAIAIIAINAAVFCTIVAAPGSPDGVIWRIKYQFISVAVFLLLVYKSCKAIAIIAINAAVFCTMVAAPESDIGAAGAAAGASYFDPAGHWSAVLPTEMH